ncbi:MAG: hypothetical protein IPM99_10060 [Rubrivivax sp.]|nr:hypothetical protein [Rubrivivax sp.]
MSLNMRIGGFSPLLRLLWALLGAVVMQVQAAECPQISTWSNQDQAFFPTFYPPSRVERSNTPGFNYFDFDSQQMKTARSTYFLLSAGPPLVKDRTFSTSIGVNLNSFESAAAAQAMFKHEWDLFFRINDARWGYMLLVAEQGQGLVWDATVGQDRQVSLLAVHKNTLINITVRSSSSAEDTNDGTEELGVRLQRARDLIDARCSGSGNIFAPSIYLDTGFSQANFQRALAAGTLKIVATDQNGREDLDWSTFRLFVAGVDKTGHALQVVARLAAERRLTHGTPADKPYLESYEFRLDPAKLTGEHNFFNIAFNGTWPVQLQICDRKGQCGQTDYQLYFGPFLMLDRFRDLRCDSTVNLDEVRFDATWGNHGYSSAANFYVALSPSTAPWETWSGEFWTLSLDLATAEGKLQWMHSSYGVQPVFPKDPILLPTGTLVQGYPVQTSGLAWNAGRREPLGGTGGWHTLLYGAVALSPGLGEGALWIETTPQKLCTLR